MGVIWRMQRYEGRTDAGFSAAGALARFGVAVLASLLVTCVVPGIASADSSPPTPDPAPGKAPSPSPSKPAPDPAPQAVNPQPAHSAPPATSRGTPAVIARVIAQPPPTSPVAHASTVSRNPARPTPSAPRDSPKVSHTPARHPVAARRTRSHPITLSLPLAFLLRDRLRPPQSPLQTSDTSHRDGILLLAASLAMGVLAVTSFSLRRRLKQLDGQP